MISNFLGKLILALCGVMILTFLAYILDFISDVKLQIIIICALLVTILVPIYLYLAAC